jgi:methionyl-tRNA formyltransferase
MPGTLIDLATLDAKLCTEYRDTGKLSEVLLRARELPKPNSPAGLNTLGDCDPDLIVSIRYRQILRDDAIALPRQGVLNLHSGILPDYRGVMATFWAMLNAEREIGSTLHRIVDSGVDTGPILGVSRTPLRPGESYLANLLRLYADGVAMLVEAIADLECGKTLSSSSQSPSVGQYYSTPDAAALKAFSAKTACLASGLELDLILASNHETRQKSVIDERA